MSLFVVNTCDAQRGQLVMMVEVSIRGCLHVQFPILTSPLEQETKN